MSTQKQVLIKADDYGRSGANSDPWRRFFDCVLDTGYAPSVGVVAESLGKPDKTTSLLLGTLSRGYGLEIWNHSLTHRDFTRLTSEQIALELSESQRIIEGELGVVPRVFGAPFNSIDLASAGAVFDSGHFNGYYFFDNFADPAINIERRHISSVEVGTQVFRPVRERNFDAEVLRRGWPEFLILQVHPYYWSNACLKGFARILTRLRERNYQCVTASNRIQYCRLKGSGIDPVPGRSLADNFVHEEQIRDLIELEMNAGSVSGSDSSYYFRMLSMGTSEIQMFLRNIGFFQLPKFKDRTTILDVGSGIGNWSTAAALIPEARVISLDREDRHLRYLRDRADGSNIEVRIAAFEEIAIESASVAGIICNNTISYVDLLQTLRKFSEVLVFSGLVFIGLQNRLYPLRDAILCGRKSEWSLAQSHMMRLVNNEGAKCGLVDKPFIRYWNSDELTAAGEGSGLRLQRRGLQPPGNYGTFAGQDVFSGHLFGKYTSMVEVGRSVRSGDVADAGYQVIRAASAAKFGDGEAVSSPEAVLIRAIKLYSENRLPQTDAASGPARSVHAAVAELDTAAVLGHVDEFGTVKDSYRFFVVCAFIERRGETLPIHFDDPFFELLTRCYSAIVNTDSAGLAGVVREMEAYLGTCTEPALAYWM